MTHRGWATDRIGLKLQKGIDRNKKPQKQRMLIGPKLNNQEENA